MLFSLSALTARIPVEDTTDYGDKVSTAVSPVLVAIFLVLFIGGLIIFVASLLIDSQKQKRWPAAVALALAAGVGVIIDATDGGGAGSLFDTIGGSISDGWDTIVGDQGNGDNGSSGGNGSKK